MFLPSSRVSSRIIDFFSHCIPYNHVYTVYITVCIERERVWAVIYAYCVIIIIIIVEGLRNDDDDRPKPRT